MKNIYKIIFIIFLYLYSFVPVNAEQIYQDELENVKPLMIIRFDQGLVNYNRTLRKAVGLALNAKPTTFFDIVSIIPELGNSKLQKNAVTQTEKVARLIQKNGVSEDKIRVTFQRSKVSNINEVHVFVR